MQLPDLPDVSPEIVRALAERHGLGTPSYVRLPEVGIFNAVYRLGDDLILRVPRHHPAFIAAARTEAIAAPAAHAAGVRTPRLIAFDDALDLLPVPYLIYERVHGETLGLLDLDPGATPQAWRELGRDLARLHTRVRADGPAGQLAAPEELPDPRPWPDELAGDGYITAVEARWLSAWLERLAPAVDAPVPPHFRHGDVQATNMMVRPGSLDYLALLDWGSAGWEDPAFDLAGIPLRAVPFVLDGYRAVAPLAHDETAEARIVWRHLQIAFFLLRREPQPGRSWAERPAAMLLEILRFFLDAPGGRWREVGP